VTGSTDLHPTELVLYGDFNCPFSALASSRAAEVERRHLADIDWRGVEHDPTVIPGLLAEVDRETFERELADVRKLLVWGEQDFLRLPAVRLNSRLATETYAAAEPADRSGLRARLFAAHWQDGVDLNDSRVVGAMGGKQRDRHTAERWNAEWAALVPPIVPVMVLPDGSVSRGLGALESLARLLA
jgi:predicted DsbA family dithiol-disulfide isomerase